jgi:hypothetical protein
MVIYAGAKVWRDFHVASNARYVPRAARLKLNAVFAAQ